MCSWEKEEHYSSRKSTTTSKSRSLVMRLWDSDSQLRGEDWSGAGDKCSSYNYVEWHGFVFKTPQHSHISRRTLLRHRISRAQRSSKLNLTLYNTTLRVSVTWPHPKQIYSSRCSADTDIFTPLKTPQELFQSFLFSKEKHNNMSCCLQSHLTTGTVVFTYKTSKFLLSLTLEI